MKHEEKEQIAYIQWFCLQYPLHIIDIYHSPNEARRSVGEWVKLKKMGLQKGFSDIAILVPRHNYHGLFIELKSKRANGKYGKPTHEQKAFIDRKKVLGYQAAVCYGLDEAISFTKDYFK